MFEPRPSVSNSEYAAHHQKVSAAQQWTRGAETWFDGSVDSVDRRLKLADRMLHEARVSLADNTANMARMAQADYLEQAKTALLTLRSDLLTGSQWRHEHSVAPTPDQMRRLVASLGSSDRRYIELEAAKVLRNNPGCSDPQELSGRAWRLASLEYSRYGKRRSNAVADALAARVFHLACRNRPRRTASAPQAIPDFPAELMYL